MAVAVAMALSFGPRYPSACDLGYPDKHSLTLAPAVGPSPGSGPSKHYADRIPPSPDSSSGSSPSRPAAAGRWTRRNDRRLASQVLGEHCKEAWRQSGELGSLEFGGLADDRWASESCATTSECCLHLEANDI